MAFAPSAKHVYDSDVEFDTPSARNPKLGTSVNGVTKFNTQYF